MTKKSNHTCAKCTANPAEYKLINGKEVALECTPCTEETLLGLVNSNFQVRVRNNGKGRDGLIELELE